MKSWMIALTVCGLGFGTVGLVEAAECRQSTVWSQSSTEFTTILLAGDATTVGIHGDGDTDLDLYVYDPLGRLVASGTTYSDLEIVSFLPMMSGQYTIRVVNRGSVYNRFVVCIE